MMLDDDEVHRILKKAVPASQEDLDRDLWPRMMQRVDSGGLGIHWVEWALVALMLALLALSPGAIPILLYQL